MLCDAGEFDLGFEGLRRSVAKGYYPAPTLATSPVFDPLRAKSTFRNLLAEAEAGRDRALVAFRDGGGERLLGPRQAA
jgi:hypothetical protein